MNKKAIKAHFTKHNKKYLLAVLLILPLLCMTNAVLYIESLSGSTMRLEAKTLPEQEFDPVMMAGFLDLDSVTQSDNLDKSVAINAWALFPTFSDNRNKTVDIVLDNVMGGPSYQIKTNLHERGDVKLMFDGPAYENITIRGLDHGFETFFSPLQMKDGYYYLNFYVKENHLNYGYINTGHMYQKSGLSFTPVAKSDVKKKHGNISWVSELNFSHAIVDDRVSYSINEAEIVGDSLFIRGWAILENYLSNRYNVYVAVTSGDGNTVAFATEKEKREDVSAFYDNALYDGSGFRMNIPLDVLTQGENQLQIFIGTEYTAMPYSYYYN